MKNLFVFLLLALSTVSYAQEDPLLTQSDVTKFVNTFPSILKEIEALGDDSMSQRMSFTMFSSAEQQILARHGWKKDDDWIKIGNIIAEYTGVKANQEFQKLSAEEKKMFEDSGEDIDNIGLSDFNKSDIELIRKNMKDLDKVLDPLFE